MIITNLLVEAQCDLMAIQTPADLRGYVLSHRAALEACLPPNTQVPYPKARGAFKCVGLGAVVVASFVIWSLVGVQICLEGKEDVGFVVC